MLPNFLVIGGVKCGTTSLHTYLLQHPDIFLPPIKELRFFSEDQIFGRGADWYASQFQEAENTHPIAVGEVTPAYLSAPDAPVRVHETLGEVRIVVVLREPVSRSYSHYWQHVRRGKENRSFEEVFDEYLNGTESSIFERSCYAKHLNRWLALHSRERMFVCGSKTLAEETPQALHAMARFLGVFEHLEVFDKEQPRLHEASQERLTGANKTVRLASHILPGIKKLLGKEQRRTLKDFLLRWNRRPFVAPPMDSDVRERVEAYFDLQNQELIDLLGSLPWDGRDPGPIAHLPKHLA